MKVVIVDDELVERKAMKKLIEENFSDIKVIGEAKNGRIAIELADELQPDVMFIDIKMPGLNGLEAIGLIRKSQPQIKFIVVSAYATFQYAKEAMQEGVKEYLLKPGKKNETIETIHRVYKEFQIERESEALLQQTFLEARKVAEQHVLMKIMQQDRTEETEKMVRDLFPEMKVGFFHVYSCSNQHQYQLLSHGLSQLSPHPCIIGELTSERVAVLFFLNENISSQGKVHALTVARDVTVFVNKREQVQIRCGIGYPATIKKLAKSYQESALSLNQLRIRDGSYYAFPRQEKEEESNEIGEVVLQHLLSGDYITTIAHFEQYYEQFMVNKREILGMERIREDLISAKRQLENQGVFVTDLDVISIQSKQGYLELIADLCERILLHHEGQKMVSKAKAYIHEHFQTSLSLEAIAEYIQLSPTYFTKLFKDQTGQTFIDYLTIYRIEQAIHLLQRTSQSLKEISYAVGYKNPNYFSRVFKKITNKSPKEYRKQIIKM